MLRTLSAVLLLLSVTGAVAHPRLETSNPARGAVLKVAPREIRMRFSERLIVNFTGLELKDAKGKTIPTGKPALVSGDAKTFAAPVTARLARGHYTVAWHAVAEDTHRVTGSYDFQVAR